MQRLLDEQTMYVSIWQLAFISGVGPRVDQSGLGLIKGFVYTAPYEEITLKRIGRPMIDRRGTCPSVMAGLGPAIHVFRREVANTWMAGGIPS